MWGGSEYEGWTCAYDAPNIYCLTLWTLIYDCNTPNQGLILYYKTFRTLIKNSLYKMLSHASIYHSAKFQVNTLKMALKLLVNAKLRISILVLDKNSNITTLNSNITTWIVYANTVGPPFNAVFGRKHFALKNRVKRGYRVKRGDTDLILNG